MATPKTATIVSPHIIHHDDHVTSISISASMKKSGDDNDNDNNVDDILSSPITSSISLSNEMFQKSGYLSPTHKHLKSMLLSSSTPRERISMNGHMEISSTMDIQILCQSISQNNNCLKEFSLSNFIISRSFDRRRQHQRTTACETTQQQTYILDPILNSLPNTIEILELNCYMNLTPKELISVNALQQFLLRCTPHTLSLCQLQLQNEHFYTIQNSGETIKVLKLNHNQQTYCMLPLKGLQHYEAYNTHYTITQHETNQIIEILQHGELQQLKLNCSNKKIQYYLNRNRFKSKTTIIDLIHEFSLEQKQHHYTYPYPHTSKSSLKGKSELQQMNVIYQYVLEYPEICKLDYYGDNVLPPPPPFVDDDDDDLIDDSTVSSSTNPSTNDDEESHDGISDTSSSDDTAENEDVPTQKKEKQKVRIWRGFWFWSDVYCNVIIQII